VRGFRRSGLRRDETLGAILTDLVQRAAASQLCGIGLDHDVDLSNFIRSNATATASSTEAYS